MQKEAKTLEVEDVLYYKYCRWKNKSDWPAAKIGRDGQRKPSPGWGGVWYE